MLFGVSVSNLFLRSLSCELYEASFSSERFRSLHGLSCVQVRLFTRTCLSDTFKTKLCFGWSYDLSPALVDVHADIAEGFNPRGETD